MEWQLLTAGSVTLIHDTVIEPTELQGMVADKSLEGALGRVNFLFNTGS